MSRFAIGNRHDRRRDKRTHEEAFALASWRKTNAENRRLLAALHDGE